MTSVIVIGGGFAGLSAATALTEKGFAVTLLEGRQVLGGRAYSFKDPKTGDSVDNGQHLFMGCYRETFRFLQRLNRLDRLTFQPRLSVDFIGPRGRRGRLRTWRVPSPWHLYSGLARLSTLSWSDRWNLRHVQAALRTPTPASELDQMTVEEWLIRARQSERARRHLWDLIAIACLNEEARIASAAPFVAVLKQAFFEGCSASRLALANVGLSDLYVDGALDYLQRTGGKVRTKSPVQRLELRRGRVESVLLRDGERLAADGVISAVQPSSLLKMLPDELVENVAYFNRMKDLAYAPILSIHLWFDRAITGVPFAGLLDTQIQWLFNRSRIQRDPRTSKGYVTLVISGAHAFVDWDDTKILSLAHEELKRLFPKAGEASIIRTLILKETQATLSPKVGSDALRPGFQSPVPHLLVAGDWTRTGLPATIESACVSGHACAEIMTRGSVAA